MNTRHNYFPCGIHGDLAPLICYFFFFFFGCFFLGSHESNALLKKI